MLTGDERRRLTEIELVLHTTDPRLANSLKRFGRSAVRRWATTGLLGGGWTLNVLLLHAGNGFRVVPVLAVGGDICHLVGKPPRRA